MRRKLEVVLYFCARPTVHFYASFAALALVVQKCGYHYPTDQASYTRYEMAKLKYRAFLIPHRIVKCSFSSSRIYLVRTERPVMPYEYCKCLQLLDFKRVKSFAQESFPFFSGRGADKYSVCDRSKALETFQRSRNPPTSPLLSLLFI